MGVRVSGGWVTLVPAPGLVAFCFSPFGVTYVPADRFASSGAMGVSSIWGSCGVTRMPESFCASPVYCCRNSSGVKPEKRLRPNCRQAEAGGQGGRWATYSSSRVMRGSSRSSIERCSGQSAVTVLLLGCASVWLLDNTCCAVVYALGRCAVSL